MMLQFNAGSFGSLLASKIDVFHELCSTLGRPEITRLESGARGPVWNLVNNRNCNWILIWAFAQSRRSLFKQVFPEHLAFIKGSSRKLWNETCRWSFTSPAGQRNSDF